MVGRRRFCEPNQPVRPVVGALQLHFSKGPENFKESNGRLTSSRSEAGAGRVILPAAWSALHGLCQGRMPCSRSALGARRDR
jgi:hypothetical protein